MRNAQCAIYLVKHLNVKYVLCPDRQSLFKRIQALVKSVEIQMSSNS